MLCPCESQKSSPSTLEKAPHAKYRPSSPLAKRTGPVLSNATGGTRPTLRVPHVAPHVGCYIARVLPILPMAEMLSTAEVAEMIGVSPDTVEKWRAAGTGPPWHNFAPLGKGSGTRHGLGRTRARLRDLPRYRRSDVEAWIASRRVDTGERPESEEETR